MKFENGLFIFRRDLRIIDNNGLNFLSTLCNNIYTIFIFTPEQVSSSNKYKSDNSIQFMIESLEDLSIAIKERGGYLNTFYGHNDEIITDCISTWDINIVGFNLDITPYAKDRDAKIIKMCKKMNVFIANDYDYYLCKPGGVLNESGNPYRKFTPFYTAAKKVPVAMPKTNKILSNCFKNKHAQFNKITLEQAKEKFIQINDNILVHGGRIEAIKQIRRGLSNIKHYKIDLTKSTSQLSAYIKFGCISIREVYKIFRSRGQFIRQLYWREFYSQILYNFPHVLKYSLNPKYDKIKWRNNNHWFQAWKKGETGFPIVDSGMRQLNTTGYMENRARLITMSFLIKTMQIDYHLGEKYFATKLIDYDPASNNGNTQWVMGGGADSQQYMRIFNPWIQAEEHDPKCQYIKKWLPELAEVPIGDILKWDTKCINYKNIKYPKPILNYSEQKQKVLKMYSDALY